MGHHSPASTSSSTEALESDQNEEPTEHGFGYPLQRMVPLESMRLGGEESPPRNLNGLYRMPASQSSSTSSHTFYVYVPAFPLISNPVPLKFTSDFEAVVDEYLSHYPNAESSQGLVCNLPSHTSPAPAPACNTSLGFRRSGLRRTGTILISDTATRKAAQHRASDPESP